MNNENIHTAFFSLFVRGLADLVSAGGRIETAGAVSEDAACSTRSRSKSRIVEGPAFRDSASFIYGVGRDPVSNNGRGLEYVLEN